MNPLWRRDDLKAVHYRLLWWIIDVGAMKKTLLFGWQTEAARQMNIHRLTVKAAVDTMVVAGVLTNVGKKGEVRLNPAAFASGASADQVRMK